MRRAFVAAILTLALITPAVASDAEAFFSSLLSLRGNGGNTVQARLVAQQFRQRGVDVGFYEVSDGVFAVLFGEFDCAKAKANLPDMHKQMSGIVQDAFKKSKCTLLLMDPVAEVPVVYLASDGNVGSFCAE